MVLLRPLVVSLMLSRSPSRSGFTLMQKPGGLMPAVNSCLPLWRYSSLLAGRKCKLFAALIDKVWREAL
jgi:hypothetical protein